MPTSSKQLVANRRNAALSTSPKTSKGKAVVSANAIKHGLRAESVTLPGEADEFRSFGKALHSHFGPNNPLEEALVARIISTSWRLRRIPSIERNLLYVLGLDYRDCDKPSSKKARFIGAEGAFLKDAEADLRLFDRFNRYESHLYRSLERDVRELERVQANQPLRRRDADMTVARFDALSTQEQIRLINEYGSGAMDAMEETESSAAG